MKRKTKLALAIVFFISGVPLFSIPLSVSSVHAEPPDWVLNPPADDDIYYGVGSAATISQAGPNEDERAQAYNYAVTELSYMAGQMIYSSFKDYQKEVSGSPGGNVAEQEVVSSIKNISENFLQGIEIRQRYQDRKSKTYYVYVVIDKESANRQIKENSKARETKLQKVIDIGINRLNKRIEAMEADVRKTHKRVGEVDKSVGRVEKGLAQVDQRTSRTAREVSELFSQMNFVKDKIESLSSGEMNWSKHLVRVKGFGVGNPNFPPAVRKRSAEEAARMDAQAKLVEFAEGLKIESKTFMKNYQVESDVKVRQVKGLLRGAYQVGETIFHPDGSAEVVMETNVKQAFSDETKG